MSEFRPGQITPATADALNRLRRDVDLLLQMRGVDPINVNWDGGVPIIVPTPDGSIPVLVSGYSSGMGVSGQGVYWFQEQIYNSQGVRVVKYGGLQGTVSTSGQYASGYGASGVLSGVPCNPLYETNQQVVPSGCFPWHGWARRRSQTNVTSGPGATVGTAFEFDYGLSGAAATGGGGISGINIGTAGSGNVTVGSWSNINSGIVNLGFANFVISSGTRTAMVSPADATESSPGIINIGSNEQVLGIGPKTFQNAVYIGLSGTIAAPQLCLRDGANVGAFAVENKTWSVGVATTAGLVHALAFNVTMNSGSIVSGLPIYKVSDSLVTFGTSSENDIAGYSGIQALFGIYIMNSIAASPTARPSIILSGYDPFIDLRGTAAAYYCQGTRGQTSTINLLSGVTNLYFIGGVFVGAA